MAIEVILTRRTAAQIIIWTVTAIQWSEFFAHDDTSSVAFYTMVAFCTWYCITNDLCNQIPKHPLGTLNLDPEPI